MSPDMGTGYPFDDLLTTSFVQGLDPKTNRRHHWTYSLRRNDAHRTDANTRQTRHLCEARVAVGAEELLLVGKTPHSPTARVS